MVAKLIVDGMVRNSLYVFTGADSKTMSVLYRLNPRFAIDYFTRNMSAFLD